MRRIDPDYLSKRLIGELALRAAIELEKANVGKDSNPRHVERLCEALSHVLREQEEDPETDTGMRNGYFESFHDLQTHDAIEHEDRPRKKVRAIIAALRDAVTSNGLSKTSANHVALCLEINWVFSASAYPRGCNCTG